MGMIQRDDMGWEVRGGFRIGSLYTPVVDSCQCMEAGQVVWYSQLLKNLPKFIVIHIVIGFGIVNKVEVDVFLELSCFLMIQWMLAS